eukprot:6583467-Alexandrium_andersonii.AAC.1
MLAAVRPHSRTSWGPPATMQAAMPRPMAPAPTTATVRPAIGRVKPEWGKRGATITILAEMRHVRSTAGGRERG